MKLTPSEEKYSILISEDMDLMIRAREFTGMEDTGYKTAEVLESLNEKYQGGLVQFYLHNHF